MSVWGVTALESLPVPLTPGGPVLWEVSQPAGPRPGELWDLGHLAQSSQVTDKAC